MKKFSIYVIKKEIQIKTKQHWDSSQSSITQTTIKAGEVMGKKEHFYTITTGGNVN
jgi:hypothetical protein